LTSKPSSRLRSPPGLHVPARPGAPWTPRGTPSYCTRKGMRRSGPNWNAQLASEWAAVLLGCLEMALWARPLECGGSSTVKLCAPPSRKRTAHPPLLSTAVPTASGRPGRACRENARCVRPLSGSNFFLQSQWTASCSSSGHRSGLAKPNPSSPTAIAESRFFRFGSGASRLGTVPARQSDLAPSLSLFVLIS
jgi:hypothetical protein